MPNELAANKCIGCRYKMPQRIGGLGFLCKSANGKCPDWIIKIALSNGLQPFTPSKKGNINKQREVWNEKLLEMNRI